MYPITLDDLKEKKRAIFIQSNKKRKIDYSSYLQYVIFSIKKNNLTMNFKKSHIKNNIPQLQHQNLSCKNKIENN